MNSRRVCSAKKKGRCARVMSVPNRRMRMGVAFVDLVSSVEEPMYVCDEWYHERCVFG